MKLKLSIINIAAMVASLIATIVYYILGIKNKDAKKKKLAYAFLGLFVINTALEIERDFRPVEITEETEEA